MQLVGMGGLVHLAPRFPSSSMQTRLSGHSSWLQSLGRTSGRMGMHRGFTRSTHCMPLSHSRSSHDSGSTFMHSTFVPRSPSDTTQVVPSPHTISSQLEGARATSFKTHVAFTRRIPQSGLLSGHSITSSMQVRRCGQFFVRQLSIPCMHLSVTTFSLGKRRIWATHSPSTSSTQHLVFV